MDDNFWKNYKETNEYLIALNEFEKELKTSSDRGIVLICGSIVDFILIRLLKFFFIKSNKIDNDLFSVNNGPLSTFDAKIKIAYYLGLITKVEKSDLVYLQRIRNRFAHQVINISFENNDIKNICSNFEIPKNCYLPQTIPFPSKGKEELQKVELNPIKKDTPPKERFIFTFKYLYSSLISRSIMIDDQRTECTKAFTSDELVSWQINEIEKMFKERQKGIEKLDNLLKETQKIIEGDEKEKIGKAKKVKADIELELSLQMQQLDILKTNITPALEVDKFTYKVIKFSMEK